MATVEKAVQAYIAFRDQKNALRKQQAEDMAPLNHKLELLEAYLLRELGKAGADSMKTPKGTTYKSLRTTAKVSSWDACLDHIKEHDLYHLLEHRVSKTAVEEYVEAQGAPPPGIDIIQEIKVNVRR